MSGTDLGVTTAKEFKNNFEAVKREFQVVRTRKSSSRSNGGHARRLSVRNDRFEVQREELEDVRRDAKDGTFFMTYKDWLKYFSVVFVAFDFPSKFRSETVSIKLRPQVSNGGHVKKKSFVKNQGFELNVGSSSGSEVFISLKQADPRQKFGRRQNEHQRPIGLHIFEKDAWDKVLASKVKAKDAWCVEAPYQIHLSVGLVTNLVKGKYVIVPSCYERDTKVDLQLSVVCQCSSSERFLRKFRGESDFSRQLQDEGVPSETSSVAVVERRKGIKLSTDELYRKLNKMKKRQADMMHVLLLYGRLLKCYDGDLKLPEELLKNSESLTALSLSSRKPLPQPNDEFLTIQPWKGQIWPPSNFASLKTKLKASGLLNRDGTIRAPEISPKLEHIYGMTNVVRNCLRLSKDGIVVYPAAAVGVAIDLKSRESRQRFNIEHSDDISCIDFCAATNQVATGQTGSKILISIWNAKTCETELVIRPKQFGKQREFKTCGLSSVCFSKTGEMLLALGNDSRHTLFVFLSS